MHRQHLSVPILTALTMAAIALLLAGTTPATASTLSPLTSAAIGNGAAPKKTAESKFCKRDRKYAAIGRRIKKLLDASPAKPVPVGRPLGEEIATSPATKRKTAKTKDKFDVLGPLMKDIGMELANIVGGDPDGVFLYVEISDRWISYSIFRDQGDLVLQYDDGQSGLYDLIRKAWTVESSSDEKIMRWSVMEYAVRGSKFDAIYRYPEEVDVEKFDDGRRARALRKHFGDKPVIYSTPGRAGEPELTS